MEGYAEGPVGSCSSSQPAGKASRAEQAGSCSFCEGRKRDLGRQAGGRLTPGGSLDLRPETVRGRGYPSLTLPFSKFLVGRAWYLGTPLWEASNRGYIPLAVSRFASSRVGPHVLCVQSSAGE